MGLISFQTSLMIGFKISNELRNQHMYKKISLSALAACSIILTLFLYIQFYQLCQHEKQRVKSLQNSSIQMTLAAYNKANKASPKKISQTLSNVPLKSAYIALLANQSQTIIAASNYDLIKKPLNYFFNDAHNLLKSIQSFYSNQTNTLFSTSHVRNAYFQVLLSAKRLPSNHLLIIAIKDTSRAYVKYLNSQRHQLFFITLMSTISILLVMALFTQKLPHCSQLSYRKFSLISATLLGICLFSLTIILILYRVPNSPYTKISRLENQHLITQEVRQYIKKHPKINLTLLPFGMHILHISNPIKNQAGLSLITWHKPSIDKHGRKLQLFFDQKISGDASPINLVKGWVMSRYSDLRLKQSFHPDRFPFDDRFITIQTWHSRVADKNIFLYPALDEANLTSFNHFIAPQIAQSASLPDWDIVESYYGIIDPSQTNPIKHYRLSLLQPTSKNLLVIILRRDLTGPFVEFFLPLIVVIIMFYFGLRIIDRSTIWRRLTYNASLLFITTLAAARAYSAVATNQATYLVISYVIIYAMIFIFTGLKLLHFHFNKNDENTMKLDLIHPALMLFWPTLASAVLINTILYFW